MPNCTPMRAWDFAIEQTRGNDIRAADLLNRLNLDVDDTIECWDSGLVVCGRMQISPELPEYARKGSVYEKRQLETGTYIKQQVPVQTAQVLPGQTAQMTGQTSILSPAEQRTAELQLATQQTAVPVPAQINASLITPPQISAAPIPQTILQPAPVHPTEIIDQQGQVFARAALAPDDPVEITLIDKKWYAAKMADGSIQSATDLGRLLGNIGGKDLEVLRRKGCRINL